MKMEEKILYDSGEALMKLRALEQAFKDEVAKQMDNTVVGFAYQSKEKCLDGKEASNLPSMGMNPFVRGYHLLVHLSDKFDSGQLISLLRWRWDHQRKQNMPQ